jgi:hypothetical protein
MIQDKHEILVGYVQHFNFNDKTSEDLLGGHPKQGRVYQIIKDDFYGYRIHIGASNTKEGKMEGILLGDSLRGDHAGKWNFDIAIVNESNILDFPLDPEDLDKLQDWFATDNKSLKDSLGKPVKVVATDANGDLREYPEASADFDPELAELTLPLLQDLGGNIEFLANRDLEITLCLADFVSYLPTTYSDKYEATGSNIAKDFLLNSKSSDAAIFNAVKYLQRYATVGFEKSQNVKDLYKAMHYILFELQRRKLNDDEEA